MTRKRSTARRNNAQSLHPSNTQTRRAQKAAAGPCPIMHECGGCAWLGVPYRKQLARKQTAIEELFTPLLKQTGWNATIDPVHGMGANAGDSAKTLAPRAFRYKAATPFAPGPHGTVCCGFYAPGTHRIVPTPTCAVEALGAREILNGVARIAEEHHITAYHEDTRRGLLRYAVLRMGWRTKEALLTIVTAQHDIPHVEDVTQELAQLDPRIVGVVQNINGQIGNAMLGHETRTLWGTDYMHDQLLDCTFEISPTAFYQTNPQQTEVLYQLAISSMELLDGDVLLDAYCGSGTIGLCAARAAANEGKHIRLIGVERNAAGIRDAQRNAELNDLSDTSTFIAEDATTYLQHAAGAHERIDVLVLDPPRAGSTAAFLQAAAAMSPRCIVYISCNPATQVRDLTVLGRAGYELTRLTPVDMFPHTEHIETGATLRRG